MNSTASETPHPTDVGPVRPLVSVVLVLIAALIAFDIADDYSSGADAVHLATEAVVMALALAGVLLLWWQVAAARRSAARLRVDLAAARREAQRFREEAAASLRGLGEAIDRQFDRWGLTPAEREVGLLLLKGLSHKEAADVRQTSETTIRQQALAVYRKAGLKGRSELSAFFLEDLLLPREQEG